LAPVERQALARSDTRCHRRGSRRARWRGGDPDADARLGRGAARPQPRLHGGDTAYDRADFVAARERFADIDLALLPIAPIEPREFMARTHLDPGEALRAFADLGARWMVPIHFDTFIQSFDEVGDAPRLLAEAMRERGLGDDRVLLLAHGEQRVLIQR
jgi:L-ascorbate metabolism protein UlaG (beta-lactamase superfamily)